MKAKHYLTILLLTMATGILHAGNTAPTVTYTTADGGTELFTMDFTNVTDSATCVNTLASAVTLTATGEWTPQQISCLTYALGGIIHEYYEDEGEEYDGWYRENENETLTSADLSGVVLGTADYDFSSLFETCIKLTTIILPSAGTTGNVNFHSAFYYCLNLTSITNLEKYTNVSSFEGTFSGCELLTSITLPVPADPSNPISFSYAFSYCHSLASITNLDKYTNVSSFEGTFAGCGWTNITLPVPANTDNAVSFRSAFESCSNLTSITNFDRYINVSNFEWTFYNCEALTNITLPVPANPANPVSFETAFSDCPNLTGITNLDKYTNVSSFKRTFANSTWTNITLPVPANTDNAVNFESAFWNCPNLTGITNLDKYTNVSSFNHTFSDSRALTCITLPIPADATQSIDFYCAFEGCTGLERIEHLEEYKNVSSFYTAFQECFNLTYVRLGCVPVNSIQSTFFLINPNCLIYLSTGVTAPEWDNIIQDGKALGDITLLNKRNMGGNQEIHYPFYCPEAFDMDGHTMTYTREWTYATEAGGWNTLYLPFAATAYADGTPLTPATGGEDGAYLLKTLTGSTTGRLTVTSAGAVQAYRPYLVGLPGSTFGEASLEGKQVTFVSATDAVIPVTPEQQAKQGGAYTMYGTLSDYQADNLYLLTNNADGSSSFDLYTDGGGVHPFRAYVTANTPDALTAPRLAINDGGAVGIRDASVGTKEIPTISRVYSVDGRLVKTVPAEAYSTLKDGLDKGIYIVNGEKMMVE